MAQKKSCSLVQVRIFWDIIQNVEDEINTFLMQKCLTRKEVEIDFKPQDPNKKMILAIMYYSEKEPVHK